MGKVVSSVLVCAVLVAVAASPVHAVRPSYDLVAPRTCLAGEWGKPSRQWRVQLGVFDDDQNAEALEHRLAARGLRTESYIGAWLDSDREPLVVVSPAFASRAAAVRASRRYGRAVGGVLVREFVVWSR